MASWRADNRHVAGNIVNDLDAGARLNLALGMSGAFTELSLTPDLTFVLSSVDPVFVDGVGGPETP